MKRIILSILTVWGLTLSGCDVLQSTLSSAYNLANCDYKYNSVSNLTISGVNLSKGLTPLMIPAVLAILEGKATSIPLNFTLNLDVKNPNSGTAAFQALQYIVSIDDVNVTNGNFNKAFSVDGGATKLLPMDLGIDVAQLMKSNTKDAVLNIVKNFIGIGDKASKVTVQLKPSFKVGEQSFASPVYIPVSFNFGGSK
jgi:LEA14-like dessication related protein